MPNSRRRRFSVHNGIAGRERDHCKIQNNGMQSSVPAKELEPKASNLVSTKSCKLKNKIQPSSSKNSNNLDKTSDSAMSMHTIIIKNTSSKTDKDVTASSSNIDMCNVLQSAHDELDLAKDLGKAEVQSKRTKPIPHEKHHHQHRIKVRSPKRRGTTISPPNLPRPKTTDDTTDIIDTIPEDVPMPIKSIHSTGTDVIDWNKETDILCIDTVETIENDARQSDHSLNDMCRICHGGDSLSHELGPLISACACRGTVGRVHVKCLERWLTESGKSRCELCGTRYATRRVHRYGVPRALVMWILSQNAKQLMVDSLGIMLMSPLAVLAAWLSGRTLAGLMTQNSRGTPWPLASTFVLACMTLVCYYCWIVSAATRHALGWWIWYRSQYEVRLTLENDD